MSGILLLTRAEISRLRRNRRYMLFTVGLPVILYLIVGKQATSKAYGVDFAAYYMVAMATFGAFAGRSTATPSGSPRNARSAGSGSCGSPRCPPTPTWSPRS